MLNSDPKKRYILGILYVAGIIALSFLLISKLEYLIRFQQYGYLGLLGMTVVTTFSWPLPLPYMILTFALGSVLNPALVGLVAGSGLAIGGVILYSAGRGGRRFLPQINISDPADEAYSGRMANFLKRIKATRLLDLAHRRGTLAIFITSLLPNPFFTPLVISMGTVRFHFVKFLFACWAGQVIKATAVAYLGYIGLGSFLRWLELVPKIQ